ncbi:MAG: ATP-grasp domain-containing protein [Aureliella sp.]
MKKRTVKIAVLEWICGGGLLDIPAAQVAVSLRAEGLGMLNMLVSGLAAEFEVFVPFDGRLVSAVDLDPRVNRIDILDLSYARQRSQLDVLHHWAAISQKCDVAWVIAPEMGTALPRSIEYLSGGGYKLINCRGEFLCNGSDKRLTAERLVAAGIPHPPTRALERVDEEWASSTAAALRFASAATHSAEPLWIVKPAAGAGGEGQRLVDQEQLWQLVLADKVDLSSPSQTTPLPRQIVQPWLLGQPASCMAIVDALGKRYWLPLVSQDFAIRESEHTLYEGVGSASRSVESPPEYIGCTYPFTAACYEPPGEAPLNAPHELLEATMDALGPGAYGPVGIDLLYHASTQTWTVIEVNARCTSSLVGLAQAYRGMLGRDMFNLLFQAGDGQFADFASRIDPFQFRIPRDKGSFP